MNKKGVDTGIASLDEDPTSQTSLINDKTNEVNEANLFYTKFNKTPVATNAKTESSVYSLYGDGQHLEASNLYQCQSEYDKVHTFNGANYYNTSLNDENENNMSNTYPSNMSTGQTGLLNSSNNSYYYQSNANDTISGSTTSSNKELETPDYHLSYNFNHHNHQPNVNYLLIN